MAPELVAFILGGAALAVVVAMAIAGLLALTGGLRFASCRHCAKWTVLTVHDQPTKVCLRCRSPLHIHPRIPSGISRMRHPAAH